MWILLPLPKEGWVGADHGIFTLLETNSTQLQIDGWKLLEDKPFLLVKAYFQGHDAFIPKTRTKKGPIDYQWLSHIAIIYWLLPPIQSWFPWDSAGKTPSILSGAGSMEIEPSKAAAWRTGVGCSDFFVWFDDCIYRYEIYLHFSYVVVSA